MEENNNALHCYTNYLICQPIKERQKGVVETIGHMTMCARRFNREKPHFITDPLQAMSYSLPECKACVKELTSFRKDISIDFTRTKITKAEAREWISAMIRSRSFDFQYAPNWRKAVSVKDMAPAPDKPRFGAYQPSPEEETEMTF